MKHLAIFALAATLAALTSCETIDAEYQMLATSAESNPRPDAILGMWHAKTYREDGMIIASTILFKKDQTGYWDDLSTGNEWHSDKSGRFKWTYASGGIWKTAWDTTRYESEFRIAGSKLLQLHRDPSGVSSRVWNRVSE